MKEPVWKLTPKGNYMCGVCKGEPECSGFINKYKFCPFCGTKMKQYELATYSPKQIIHRYEMGD